MASAQLPTSASGPASAFVGRCSSLVDTARPSGQTPATFDVVAPPSVPINTSRAPMLRFLPSLNRRPEPTRWVSGVSMPHRDGLPRKQNPDILSERMSNTEWRIGEEADGVRLDKYLAD